MARASIGATRRRPGSSPYGSDGPRASRGRNDRWFNGRETTVRTCRRSSDEVGQATRVESGSRKTTLHPHSAPMRILVPVGWLPLACLLGCGSKSGDSSMMGAGGLAAAAAAVPAARPRPAAPRWRPTRSIAACAAHSCLGGTCVGGRCQPVRLADLPVAIGLAVDDSSLYVTNGLTGEVLRMPKAGGAATPLATAQLTPTSPVVNAAGISGATPAVCSGSAAARSCSCRREARRPCRSPSS